MTSQHDKAIAFQALHQRDAAFIIPNPWDAGTARLLEILGFEALATTSAGYAFSLGKVDNKVGQGAMIAHVREIAAATSLPVSGDLEDGFGDSPETVAETIRLAADAGLVGCSIEDSINRDGTPPLHEIEFAAERIRAASEAARSLPFPFTLTGRAENFLVGKGDLADVIARLQAYQEAGADVLFAPGLATREDIEQVVRSVDRPVSVVMGLQGVQLTQADLSDIGVRRISVGSALSRAALGAFLRAAREMQSSGSFTFADEAVPYKEISSLLST